MDLRYIMPMEVNLEVSPNLNLDKKVGVISLLQHQLRLFSAPPPPIQRLFWKMFRISVAALQSLEFFLSYVVHLLFGFYIFSSTVAGDLSLALNDLFFKSNIEPKIRDGNSASSDNDLPPIVLVHGIFGFGKGILGGLSYFVGAEKKDEKVLGPDLGSLTNIYDRARELFYYLKGGQVDFGEEYNKACGILSLERYMKKGITLNGMKNTQFTYLGTRPELR